MTIQLDARMVILDKLPVKLPPKEFDLLAKLAQNEHIVFTREQLLNTVWGIDYYGDTRTVDTHIKSLREHLGGFRNHIITVWGVGYKFEQPKKNDRKRSSSMAVQLWGIMMVLVIFTVIFMWGFQIYFMEQNYINSSITEIQNRLSSVLPELAATDLAENETMLSYLTSTAGGRR